MSRKLIQAVFFITLLLTASACNTLQNMKTNELMTEFKETFWQYAKHLRWGHFRDVTKFMTDEYVAAAMIKAEQLKERRVAKVQPIVWAIDEEKKQVTGDVTIEYYATDKAVIRTTIQKQTWVRVGKLWKLDTGLPDLP